MARDKIAARFLATQDRATTTCNIYLSANRLRQDNLSKILLNRNNLASSRRGANIYH